jgi:hypothetical protein
VGKGPKVQLIIINQKEPVFVHRVSIVRTVQF